MSYSPRAVKWRIFWAVLPLYLAVGWLYYLHHTDEQALYSVAWEVHQQELSVQRAMSLAASASYSARTHDHDPPEWKGGAY